MCKQKKLTLFRNVQNRLRLFLLGLEAVGGCEVSLPKIVLLINFLLEMCKQKFKTCIHVQTMNYRKLLFSNIGS